MNLSVAKYDVTGRTLNFSKLEKEIIASGAVVGFVGAPRIGGTDLHIQATSVADQSALDTVIADHVAETLAEAQTNRIKVLGDEISAFITDRYPETTQLSLLMLMTEGNAKNWALRKSTIQTGIDWIKDCLAEYYTRRTEIQAATTITDVNAINLDTTTVEASDPELDLESLIDIVT